MPNRFPVIVLAVVLSACAGQREGLALEGNSKRLRQELARTFVSKGAYVAAMPYLQSALKEEPKDAELATLYGIVLRENGLYPQAEEQFRKSLLIDASYAATWAGMGMLYDLEGRSEKAEAAHHRALKLDPENAGEWNNLGFSLYVAGKTDASIAALEKALALSPGMVVAYNNLGFAYARKEDFAAARRCFLAVGGEKGAKANLKLAALMAKPVAIETEEEEQP